MSTGFADVSRVLNDMAYLCDKYAPLEGIPKYDPKQDPAWGRHSRSVLAHSSDRIEVGAQLSHL